MHSASNYGLGFSPGSIHLLPRSKPSPFDLFVDDFKAMVPRGVGTSRKRAVVLLFLGVVALVSILLLTRGGSGIDASILEGRFTYPSYIASKTGTTGAESPTQAAFSPTSPLPLTSLTIVSVGTKPDQLENPWFSLSTKTPIESLREAAKTSTGPLLVSLSGLVDPTRLQYHLDLYDSLSEVFSAVGFGSQKNLKFVREDGVLWITKAIKSRASKSGCTVVDILETDFILSKETLVEALEMVDYKESLLELFYVLSLRGDSVASCVKPGIDGDLPSPSKSPFADYMKVNWTFQHKHELVDVIDERTDQWGRVHGDGPLTYCNTTASKKWWDTYGTQTGNLKNARSSLWDWKLVLDELGLPLKISSGTLLGWYRQCDFIPYTSDLDTTMPIWMYTPALLKICEKHNFKLLRTFGNSSLENPRGGWETTFKHIPTGNSLDVFWIYPDKDGKEWTSLWVRPQELHRIYFAPGILGDNKPADFQGIRVEVPRDPVEYLYSSYGANWNIPKSKWTWWNSVSNQHKPPFPAWPEVTNVTIHPLVAEHRAQKKVFIRQENIRKGLFKD